VLYAHVVAFFVKISTQAFQLCHSGDFNLSQESPTSPVALQSLLQLLTANPDLWAELSQPCSHPLATPQKKCRNKKLSDPVKHTQSSRDMVICDDVTESRFSDSPDDDSNILLADLIQHALTGSWNWYSRE
jgi:hypothetical protein